MKRKLNLIELLLSTVVIIIGGFVTYNMALHRLYSVGSNTIFKTEERCKEYKNLYIAEMKKSIPNNTNNILAEAKKKSCTK